MIKPVVKPVMLGTVAVMLSLLSACGGTSTPSFPISQLSTSTALETLASANIGQPPTAPSLPSGTGGTSIRGTGLTGQGLNLLTQIRSLSTTICTDSATEWEDPVTYDSAPGQICATISTTNTSLTVDIDMEKWDVYNPSSHQVLETIEGALSLTLSGTISGTEALQWRDQSNQLLGFGSGQFSISSDFKSFQLQQSITLVNERSFDATFVVSYNGDVILTTGDWSSSLFDPSGNVQVRVDFNDASIEIDTGVTPEVETLQLPFVITVFLEDGVKEYEGEFNFVGDTETIDYLESDLTDKNTNELAGRIQLDPENSEVTVYTYDANTDSFILVQNP